MLPGEMIETTITREIIERDHFVILLSRNSLRSHWVCLESVVSKAKETCGYGWDSILRVDDCLDDWKFLVDVQEHIEASIADMEKHMSEAENIDLIINSLIRSDNGRLNSRIITLP